MNWLLNFYYFKEFTFELRYKFAFDCSTDGGYSFIVQVFNELVVISFIALARIVLRLSRA